MAITFELMIIDLGKQVSKMWWHFDASYCICSVFRLFWPFSNQNHWSAFSSQ